MDTEIEERDALVVQNLALAQAIARRYFRHDPVGDEDLLQVAYLGLTKAARRYRSDLGPSFAAFAAPTIEGEVKRHLRDHGWFVRPPRAEQELNRRIRRTAPQLAQQLGRQPSTGDLARDLDETPAAIAAAAACDGCLRPVSLDTPASHDSSATIGDALAGAGPDDDLDRRIMLWAALHTLSARDRMIVYLRFFEDLSQQRIADRLGVSQMHVSRLLRRTLERLHLAIGA